MCIPLCRHDDCLRQKNQPEKSKVLPHDVIDDNFDILGNADLSCGGKNPAPHCPPANKGEASGPSSNSTSVFFQWDHQKEVFEPQMVIAVFAIVLNIGLLLMFLRHRASLHRLPKRFILLTISTDLAVALFLLCYFAVVNYRVFWKATLVPLVQLNCGSTKSLILGALNIVQLGSAGGCALELYFIVTAGIFRLRRPKLCSTILWVVFLATLLAPVVFFAVGLNPVQTEHVGCELVDEWLPETPGRNFTSGVSVEDICIAQYCSPLLVFSPNSDTKMARALAGLNLLVISLCVCWLLICPPVIFCYSSVCYSLTQGSHLVATGSSVRMKQRRKRIQLTTVVTMCIMLICWLPWLLVTSIQSVTTNSIFAELSQMLILLQICVNPLVYSFRIRRLCSWRRMPSRQSSINASASHYRMSALRRKSNESVLLTNN